MVVPGGVLGAVSIDNKTQTPFTCGISEETDGESRILCAFPLFGGFLDVIAPIEKVVLTFANNPVNTGAEIAQSFGPSAMIDLTGAPNNTRDVTFDLNSGWGAATYVTPIPAGTNLVPFLIQNDAAAVRKLLAA